MAVNNTLMVASKVLQQYLVDKDTGLPLAAGVITLYIDDSDRQTLKPWYYQTGTVTDGYTFIALDNPLTLSSVGTIQDPNGNDVIPFYYPFDEDNSTDPQPYYITVHNSDSVLQFTRENFPYMPLTPTVEGNPTFNNLIINNGYWRNIGSATVTDSFCKIIAPSQHENYQIQDNLTTLTQLGGIAGEVNGCFSDIRFIKDVTDDHDTDTLTFQPMTDITLSSEGVTQVAPEYYLEVRCTDSDSHATVKAIQYPISMHMATLKNQPFSVCLWAKNEGGSDNNHIFLQIYAYTGSGTGVGGGTKTDSAIFPIGSSTGQFDISNDGQFHFISSTVDFFPDTDQMILGNAGDDALFLRVQFPTGSGGGGEFHISHTKPQLYLGSEFPSDQFDTYDQVAAIVNNERTGDIKFTSNNFWPWGYVPMNNGTIGNSNSNATTYKNTNAWQLYQQLWYANQFSQGYAPMYSSAGALVQYGASAIDDWDANRQLSLLRALGQVIAGTSLTIDAAQSFTADSGTDVITVTDTTRYGNGTPVIVFNIGGALPGGLTAGTVYYSYYLTKTTMKLTSALIPESYTLICYCAAASDADVSANYNNGTAGVGATLTNNSTQTQFSLNGIAGTVGLFYLIKDQTNPFENGIYELTDLGSASTNWVLTRISGYDSPDEIKPLTYAISLAGTQAGSWQQTLYVSAVGTDDITFTSGPSFTFVDISSAGSGTHYIQAKVDGIGLQEGEKTHTLVRSELPDPVSASCNTGSSVAAPPGNTYISSAGTGSAVIPNTGGNQPHTIMQPTTYFNLFVKL